jgi:excisionase family DNA binding protein
MAADPRWPTWPERGAPVEARPAHLIPRYTPAPAARPAITRRVYRVKEIAAMSGLAEKTIYERIYSGLLPRANHDGRAVLVPAHAVHAWLDSLAGDGELGGAPR